MQNQTSARFDTTGRIVPESITFLETTTGVPYAKFTITDITNFSPGSETTRTMMSFSGPNGGNLQYIKPMLLSILDGHSPIRTIWSESRTNSGALIAIRESTKTETNNNHQPQQKTNKQPNNEPNRNRPYNNKYDPPHYFSLIPPAMSIDEYGI